MESGLAARAMPRVLGMGSRSQAALVSDRDDAALFPAIRILERYGSAKSGRARRVRTACRRRGDPKRSDPPIVDVAAEIAGRDRIDELGLLRRQCHDPEMRPYRDAHVPEDAMPFLDQGVVDRHPGIVDHAVHHSERVGLRYPAVIVDPTRPVAALRCIDLVYRDDLARLGIGAAASTLTANCVRPRMAVSQFNAADGVFSPKLAKPEPNR